MVRAETRASRALAIWERGERFQIVGSIAKGGSHEAVWALPYQTLTGATEDVKVPGRFGLVMREFMTLLIATSGILAIVVIVMILTVLLRALRALCGRRYA
jgi:hypothetical protein